MLLAIQLLFSSNITGQSTSNLRHKWINCTLDSLVLDTLSIVPNSEQISQLQKDTINKQIYNIDYAKAIIYFKQKPLNDSISITYRVFDFNLSKTFKHKDIGIINRFSDNLEDPFSVEIKDGSNFIDFGNLNYNGSFGRDLSIGNNQDLIVNSNFNLQFSGKLKNDIEVIAAISDQSLPIQPDGNTAQLQEFDRIFMQFKKGRSVLTLGDFEVKAQNSYFMKYLKKLQGIDVKTAATIGKAATMKMGGSMAIAKGKFTRNTFAGEEGNQGPYKLIGQQNELFIIILSGTERVFIDGNQLERGATKDYVIDYNLGELIFTPNQLITKDKRIVIEFEYAEQYYQKTLAQAYQQTEFDKLKLNLNFYSSQDSKNQPIQGPFNEAQFNALNLAGNNVDEAVLPGFARSNYIADQIQYIKKDTSVFDLLYEEIFTFSSTDTMELYNVSFTNVGFGNGDYIISNALNNNRVYEWIAPDSLTGLKLGSFQPLIKLVTPKRNQMFTLGADYRLTKNQTITTELALSNNDVNTLSDLGNNSNVGLAAKAAYEAAIPLSKNKKNTWQWDNKISYEWKQNTFDAIERYRPIEFKRDWNLKHNNDTLTESWLKAYSGITESSIGSIGISYGNLISGSLYKGQQMALVGNAQKNNWLFSANSSLVLADEEGDRSSFLRHSYLLTKTFKHLNNLQTSFYFNEEQFKNTLSLSDTLNNDSFKFNSYEWSLNNMDSSRNKIEFRYNLREDFTALENEFERATIANTFNLKGRISNKKINHIANYNFTYRDLSYKQKNDERPNEKTVLAQTEYRFNILKGFVKSSTLYEIGSGQQQKVEFTYIEVQDGQGNFAWRDYNNNMLKEDDEFERTAPTDSARYNRITVPTNLYLKTNSVKFNQSINILFKKILTQKKGFGNFLSRFQLQGNYIIDRKNQGEDLAAKQYNPFYFTSIDSSLISSNANVKNTLIFNRSSPTFSAEVFQRYSNNKIALISGFDQSLIDEYGTGLRYNISKILTTELDAKQGTLSNNSDNFVNRIYDIEYWELKPALSFILRNSFRGSLTYRYKKSENTNKLYGQNERTKQNELKADIRYSLLNKSSIHTTFAYDFITFNGDAYSALAYTMLEGLQPGNNFVWTLRFDQRFKGNLNLGLTYEGRKLGEQDVSHTARANFRAVF